MVLQVVCAAVLPASQPAKQILPDQLHYKQKAKEYLITMAFNTLLWIISYFAFS